MVSDASAADVNFQPRRSRLTARNRPWTVAPPIKASARRRRHAHSRLALWLQWCLSSFGQSSGCIEPASHTSVYGGLGWTYLQLQGKREKKLHGSTHCNERRALCLPRSPGSVPEESSGAVTLTRPRRHPSRGRSPLGQESLGPRPGGAVRTSAHLPACSVVGWVACGSLAGTVTSLLPEETISASHTFPLFAFPSRRARTRLSPTTTSAPMSAWETTR